MPKFPIGGWGGLDDLGMGGDQRFTRFLKNVNVRQGRIEGRAGIDELNNVTGTSATTPIHALFPYYDKDLITQILRITPTAAFELTNSADGTWTDVTGVAFTSAGTDRPQAVNHDELLIFTNGVDLPRKWAGSGNDTVVLGGTPPYGKAIMAMKGFVMLANVSDDGTFSDVTLGHLKVRLAEDYDGDWSPCEGHELVLDETNGAILAGKKYGEFGVWLKTDSLISTRWVGSGRGFSQRQLRFGGVDKGGISALTFKSTKAGIIFMGTDYELYITDGQNVKPLPPRVQNKLGTDMQKSKAFESFAEVVESREEYNLFFPIDSDTYSAGRIRYNYRTGEYAYSEYDGHAFISACSFRWLNTEAERLICAADDDLVWEMDTTDNVDDAGTQVDRYFETDWLNYGNQESKAFHGAYLVFRKNLNCRVKIGVAVDRSRKFLYEKSFSLRGTPSAGGRTAESDTVIEYIPGEQLEGTEFNLRIKFYHTGTNLAELRHGYILWDRAAGLQELRETGGVEKGG